MTAKELKLDYFKFYDVENREAAGNLLLRGQFDRRPQKMRLRLLDFFANPVSKNGEPLYDKNAHLAWYRGVQPPEPIRRVLLENQFGKFDIRTGTGYGLLVPTQKIERGSAFPGQLDHYKVYRLVDVELVPNKVLKLRDQFGGDEVKLRLPLYLAVPVMKRHRNKTYPIHNDRAHLLIFSVTTRDLRKNIKLRNQFDSGTGVRTVRSLMVGAPSLKRKWKQV
jgi:hypothetical protein